MGIGPIPNGFGIEVTLNVYLIGMEQAEAEQLVAAAIHCFVHIQMQIVAILMLILIS